MFLYICTGRRGVLLFVFPCVRPHTATRGWGHCILTFMMSAAERQHRRRAKLRPRIIVQPRAPAVLLFCGTHHVSRYIVNASTSCCIMRSYTRENHKPNPSVLCVFKYIWIVLLYQVGTNTGDRRWWRPYLEETLAQDLLEFAVQHEVLCPASDGDEQLGQAQVPAVPQQVERQFRLCVLWQANVLRNARQRVVSTT